MRLSELPRLQFMAADHTVDAIEPSACGAEIAARAAWFRAHYPPGTAIGLALRSGPPLVIAWLATLAAGMRPLILQYPTAKQTRDYWRSSVLNTAALVDLAAVVGDERVAGLLDDAGVAVIAPDVRAGGEHAAIDDLGDFAILQLSSGTTGHRKAVAFTRAQLEQHVRDYDAALRLSPENDHIVSWLPLYHDMGYIACFVMPLLLGIPVTTIDPEVWVADKPILFDAIERVRGTICYMPNFGFETLAQPTTRDLTSMRRWISCSEPVLAATARRFLAATGADPRTFSACYAMAENVFAVTLSDGLVEREVDGTATVSCGPPIPGTEVRAVDGELWVRSPASIARYVGGDDIRDPHGFYPTGDMGTVVDGEIHVTGRKRDVLIQAGRKFMLSAIDAALNELLPAVKGRAAAVALLDDRVGTEKLALLIEAADFFERADHRAVADAVQARTGLDFLEIHFVPPRFLTKTSSGKINRAVSARHWAERERAAATEVRHDPAGEIERVFGTLPQHLPVGESLDSLSLTLLRIILTDAGVDYTPELTLGGVRAELAAAPVVRADDGVRPLRIVSLADRRAMRGLNEGSLLALSKQIKRPLVFEHICLPPTPILLSDMVFYDYFRARLAQEDWFEAIGRQADKLRTADAIILDDAAEMHFPLTQFYPVLSHRLERAPDADLLAFRWQRYVEFHDRLPVAVVPGATMPIAGRAATIAALSRYLGVPFFRIASVQAFEPFTRDWEFRPLSSLSGGPGLKRLPPNQFVKAFGKWLRDRIDAGSIAVPPGEAKVVRLDMTDLAHFCSHAVNRDVLDTALARYDTFCIVGQPASVAYVRKALTAAKKTWFEAPSYHPNVLAHLPPFDCLLSCGATGKIDTAGPAIAIMGAGWGSRSLNTGLEDDFELRGALPSADANEWFNLGGTGRALDAVERASVGRLNREAKDERTAAADTPVPANTSRDDPARHEARREQARAARRAARRATR